MMGGCSSSLLVGTVHQGGDWGGGAIYPSDMGLLDTLTCDVTNGSVLEMAYND